MKKANIEIREMLKEKHVPVYAVAAKMGVHENTIFRRLRFELSEADKKSFCNIINDIVAENVSD